MTTIFPFPAVPFGTMSLAAGLFFTAPLAHAVLLLDPSGGIVTASATVGPLDKDNGTYQGISGPYGMYFGTVALTSQPTISLNGHFYYGSGDDLQLANLGTTGISRIAPMWHDFQLGATGQVIEELGNTYYAVTWNKMESQEVRGTYATFQAIFFDFATTLHGITFNPGDIAFSYGDIGAYQLVNEVVVGIEAPGKYAALPGSESYFGFSSYSAFGEFPVGPGEYLHFRPNGSGNYTATIAPIPEPSAALLGGLGLLALARRKRG